MCTLVYTEKLADAAKKVSDRKEKGSDKDKGSDQDGNTEGGKAGKGRKKDKGSEAEAAGGAAGEGVDAMEEEMGSTPAHSCYTPTIVPYSHRTPTYPLPLPPLLL